MMTRTTRHGVRDDAAWFPAFELSQAGWPTARIAQIMDVTPRWAATRIRRIARLTEAEREALRAVVLGRLSREAEALALLGRTAEAKTALAQLDLAAKAAEKQEALQTSAQDAPRQPAARREEGEYASIATEELRARLRENLERQAERFGFTEELEQAFREGEARHAAGAAREGGEICAPAPVEPAPAPIAAGGAGYRRQRPDRAGPSVRRL